MIQVKTTGLPAGVGEPTYTIRLEDSIMDSLELSLRDLQDTATYSTSRFCTITPGKWNLTPVRQFGRCSDHYLRDDGSVSLNSE